MKSKFMNAAFIGLVMAATSLTSNATLILSTDFDDRIVSGNTASNLAWDLNGVSSPGDLSTDFNLFDTTAAEDRFAVIRNMHNEGSWSVDIALNVLSTNDIALSSVTLDAFIFSNRGVLQGDSRDLDINASLFDSSNSLMMSVDLFDIYPSTGSFTNGSNISLSFEGLALFANNNYVLRLTADGQGPGNNAGFDNLVINGELTAVPEPTTLAIFALGIMGLASSRFKKQA